MRYKDTIVPAWISEELVEVLNLAFLMSVNDRLFGYTGVDHKEFENRIIRIQQCLVDRTADY